MVDNTRAVLKDLPAANWFKRGEDLFDDHIEPSGIGLYDLLLHSQDRAYTVEQLYELLGSSGLHVVKFIALSRVHYKPEYFLTDTALLERIAAMGLPRQQAVGELLSGQIIKHSCFVSPLTDTVADIDDDENIPLFTPEVREGFRGILDRPTWSIQAPPLPPLSIKPGKFARAAFTLMDGTRSIGRIVAQVREQFSNGPTVEEILVQFTTVFEALREWGDVVVLRHPDSGQLLRPEIR